MSDTEKSVAERMYENHKANVKRYQQTTGLQKTRDRNRLRMQQMKENEPEKYELVLERAKAWSKANRELIYARRRERKLKQKMAESENSDP